MKPFQLSLRQHLLSWSTVLMTVMILFSGCTPAFTLTPTPIPPTSTLAVNSPAPPPSDTFPTGHYKAVTVLYADEIIFYENGNYIIHFRGELTWENAYKGTYTTIGDQLVFDDPATECAGHPGTYDWSFDGTTLILRVIEDTCTALPRAEDLGHAWVKLP